MIIENWFNSFKATKSLLSINVSDLNFVDLEISDLFDKYIEIEPIEKNYCEILSYNFSILKKYWKDELEKGGNNYTR